jgi:hypothetical protein
VGCSSALPASASFWPAKGIIMKSKNLIKPAIYQRKSITETGLKNDKEKKNQKKKKYKGMG